jgi:GTP-binding protein
VKIVSVDFLKSAYESAHFPTDRRREIAFLGRSNVGKSSLINSLLQRKGLARTSNTPGRTQCINFFTINDQFYFVDLPGYGYAKVSKAMRSDWGKMAEDYLSDREELDLCIQLVDARHKPSKLDVQLHEWLVFNKKPQLIVATKADKISRNELARALRSIREDLPGAKVIGYSAQTGTGRDQVWAEILASMQN